MKAPARVVLDTNVVLSAYLAVAGRAHMLVSGDKDLLALAGTRGLGPVLSVEAFSRQLPLT